MTKPLHFKYVPQSDFMRDLPSSRPVFVAVALSLAAAIALGLTRFSYGLLIPPMRADLNWSYFVAGLMNTGNALGYFIGAIMTTKLIRKFGVWNLLIISSFVSSVFTFLPGLVTETTILLMMRICAGVASSFIFISGGVLSARLGAMHSGRAGLLIGIYYGGTGVGITLSALLVPVAQSSAQLAGAVHTWQWSWIALGVLCLLATCLLAGPAKTIGEAPQNQSNGRNFAINDFVYSLIGYLMFGVGYIGYMTFVIALLKDQGISLGYITAFYALLGLSVVASSRVWAKMLDHFKGGQSLAILNFILSLACVLPAVTTSTSLLFASGIVFGGVFLSVVASTTLIVRHNLPQDSWSAGISAFTTAFALGQILGPSVVGWIADGSGGLERGLMVSAAALLIAAILSSQQKHLQH
ncbi:YbfB/YjiJ family MFS transporter [Methylorubrum sp. SL192]|uniref:YbfB/YjiJ family MFS transporter n=1 Tax=Methylorubrum sp. SL192 TaxID=2995167 RepID=UPI0022743382|nr:YbfB/YjiJ family MFS transporter [Methylorubrum sp. SL192]MCY1640529.1 YbfB/YjiJ family MFS transporter [Methylorubrum sp. SL192]